MGCGGSKKAQAPEPWDGQPAEELEGEVIDLAVFGTAVTIAAEPSPTLPSDDDGPPDKPAEGVPAAPDPAEPACSADAAGYTAPS